jgi:hypothetical protein
MVPDGVDYGAVASSLRSAQSHMAATAPPKHAASHSAPSSPSVGYQSDGVVDFEAEVRSFKSRNAAAAKRMQQGPYDVSSDSDSDSERGKRHTAAQLREASQKLGVASLRGASQAGDSFAGPHAHLRSASTPQQAVRTARKSSVAALAASRRSAQMANQSKTGEKTGTAAEADAEAVSKLGASRGMRRSAAATETTGAPPPQASNSLQERVCFILPAQVAAIFRVRVCALHLPRRMLCWLIMSVHRCAATCLSQVHLEV